VVLVLAGDIALRAATESRLAARAEAGLGLRARPDVDLQGFPFFVHALRRRFPEASIEVRDVRVQGLAVDRVRFELEDVGFGSTAALAGGGGAISAGNVRGTVEVTEDALGSFLERRGVSLRVALLDSGNARISGTTSILGMEIELSAQGMLAVADGRLEFRPDRIEAVGGIEVPTSALVIAVELPEVAPDLVYQRINVSQGRMSVSFRLRGSGVHTLWLF
jgi:hypothetical protein